VALSPVNGRDELSEIFAETRIPLANETIVKKMDASFAYRLSDYDSAGAATGWSSALSLSPWANLDLFARRSAAVRAPSISELYLPPRGGTLNIADPCAANASVSASTREKCRSLGIPDSFAPSAQELAVPYRIRGNDQLQEETGYTTSFGLSYRPLEDNALTLRAEYFDIDIHNAIVNIDPTFKLNSCYSAEDFPTSWFCRGLNRGTSAQNFRFTQIDAGLENIGRFQTRGSDFEIASQIPLWGGSLHNRLLATYTNLWQQTANNKTLNRLGEPGLQQWKGSYSLGFDKGAWDSTVSVRHLKSGTIENDSTQAYIRANNHVPSVSYFDAYLGYRFTQAQANGKSRRVYLSAHNLTDQDPPYVPGESLRNGNPGTSTSASVYDVRGRYWRVGMEYEF
jgi:outer membrane receptor protein involved in Fe transport